MFGKRFEFHRTAFVLGVIDNLNSYLYIYLLVSKFAKISMETKDKIRNLAEELIRTKGYNAFSYADLSAPLQIKNAAIHYHFPSNAAGKSDT